MLHVLSFDHLAFVRKTQQPARLADENDYGGWEARDAAKSLIEAVTCGAVTAVDGPGVSWGGGRARAERWKFLRSPSSAARDPGPPMTSSPIPAARSQYLLDLLAQVPDPRKRRGRRHALAGLLAVGIAAVIAGSRSFSAIGQWAADADRQEQLNALVARWELENASLNKLGELKKRLDDLEGRAERAQRDGDYEAVSWLLFGEIPAVHQQLTEASTTFRAASSDEGTAAAGTSAATPMVKEEVGPDDVADVVSAWIGVPAGRLLEGETG
jgi:hypothetical protein